MKVREFKTFLMLAGFYDTDGDGEYLHSTIPITVEIGMSIISVGVTEEQHTSNMEVSIAVADEELDQLNITHIHNYFNELVAKL